MRNLTVLFCSSLVSLICQSAFAENTNKPVQDSSKFTLTLTNDTKKCQLTAEKKGDTKRTITLLLDSPCFWVSASKTSGSLQYSYPEKQADTTLLVAGTPLDWSDEEKVHHKLPVNEMCSSYLQGIIINDNEMFAVDEKMDAPHCKGLVVDEKVFHQAASSKHRYQEVSANLVTTPESEEIQHKPTQGKPLTGEDNSFLGSIQRTIQRVFSQGE